MARSSSTGTSNPLTSSVMMSSGPVGQAAADAVRNVVQTAPQVDSQVREWVKVQPGGEGVIAGVDNALDTFFGGSAGTAAEMISTAIGDGIVPA